MNKSSGQRRNFLCLEQGNNACSQTTPRPRGVCAWLRGTIVIYQASFTVITVIAVTRPLTLRVAYELVPQLVELQRKAPSAEQPLPAVSSAASSEAVHRRAPTFSQKSLAQLKLRVPLHPGSGGRSDSPHTAGEPLRFGSHPRSRQEEAEKVTAAVVEHWPSPTRTCREASETAARCWVAAAERKKDR